MRLPRTQDYSVPAPGTTEAVELGCTCRVIGHEARTDEAAPATIFAAPDANCLVHGSAAHVEERD